MSQVDETDWGRVVAAWLGPLTREAGGGTLPAELANLRDAPTRERFLLAWRLGPDRSGTAPDEVTGAVPPPWAAMDAAAALTAGGPETGGAPAGGWALLSVSLGPVQSFIAAARSLRDLWSGSAILSWLCFQALRPIVSRLGPQAVVLPSLRGNPLLDLWLRGECGLSDLPKPRADALRSPSLPNRFLAVVPWGEDGATARALADAAQDGARSALMELARAVQGEVQLVHGHRFAGWDADLDRQIGALLTIRAVAAPREDDWRTVFDEASRLAEAAKWLDLPPAAPPPTAVGGRPKCTLLGSWEQVGDKEFWEKAAERLMLDGVRLRAGERFCAQSLVKRFAFPALLDKKLELKRTALRFPDTATVAAATWLKGVELPWEAWRDDGTRWSGRWLHPGDEGGEADDDERCPDEVRTRIAAAIKTHGPPPIYYAVLHGDGDNMGKLLQAAEGPAGLGALSAALSSFAVGAAPGIVADHDGTLIYAGGDDVLAVLPARQALACTRALRHRFKGELDPAVPALVQDQVGLSVGIAIVHYKEDLRRALDAARNAEKRAKDAGRDRIGLDIVRRSGEHAETVVRYEDVAWMTALTDAFVEGASDRWAYKAMELAPTLDGMALAKPAEGELRRQVGRMEKPDREKLNRHLEPIFPAQAADPRPEPSDENPEPPLVSCFRAYRTRRGEVERSRGPLQDFLTLVQSASFLARGRDR